MSVEIRAHTARGEMRSGVVAVLARIDDRRKRSPLAASPGQVLLDPNFLPEG